MLNYSSVHKWQAGLGMSFTELVHNKIDERRNTRFAAISAAAAQEAQIRASAAPLIRALTEMVVRLSQDPMFADVIGNPVPTLKPADSEDAAIVQIKGRAGSCHFYLDRDNSLYLDIVVNSEAQRALGCGCSYTGMNWARGNIADLDGFIAHAEDHIAEFLADMCSDAQ